MTCEQCQTSFVVTEEHKAYYERISPVIQGSLHRIAHPRLCPDCRKQRRLSFRNERKLYARTSSLSGKPIISVFSPDKPQLVYDYDEWWNDRVDNLTFGREFDFNRPFFDQFQELLRDVPQMALIGSQNENCAYCHLYANCKRCYLIFESSNNEDCLYGYWLQKCVGCVDASFSHECQYCYEIENCYGCYNLRYSRNCSGCYDSAYLDNCIGCRNCFGCSGLHQKENYLFNRKASLAEIAEHQQSLSSKRNVEQFLRSLDELSITVPKKYAHIANSEDCTGDYIKSSKACHNCYHAHDAEHCQFAEHVWRNSKYNMDVSTAGRDAELIYESINVGIGSYNVHFTVQGWSCTDVEYCFSVFNSKNVFGCVGLKNNSYCILNKEYSQEEYDSLRSRIIEHMRKTCEYGEFFPARLSPFGYNETVAFDSFPLSQPEAQLQGFSWSSYESPAPKVSNVVAATDIPETISEVRDEIISQALLCEESHRPFRIIEQELRFYREHSIPLPRKHPEVRHARRMALRNPQHLWNRECRSCRTSVQSTYAVDRPEDILCEPCYHKTLL